TIVAIPDPQNFTTNLRWKGARKIYRRMMKWIADNKFSENIAFVLFQGDLVNLNKDAIAGNFLGPLFRHLEYSVPYVLVEGNHDIGVDGAANNRDSFLLPYHPPQRFQLVPSVTAPHFAGTFDSRISNAVYDFTL